ncbi:MAG: hypothetical protein R3D25_09910 [Geminicoccaceae bacterium]
MARELIARRAAGMSGRGARRGRAQALTLGADLVGINNRNLKTLQVDIGTTEALAPLGAGRPAARRRVGFCPCRSGADGCHRAGAKAFLVGEALMREADVTRATRRLLGLDTKA